MLQSVNILLLCIGIAMLTFGGEALIRGSLSAARRLGVSPLLSGLVIVGFGTSAPELVVSINAALAGNPDMAVGNVVGSNIGNILLILGVCGLITPLVVKPLVLRRDAVTMVVASALFLLLVFLSGGTIERIGGVFLLLCLCLYLSWAYWSERYYEAPSAALHLAEEQELQVSEKSTLWIITALSLGLMFLISGSQVLLTGAIGIAEYFDVPEAVISLTLVSVGTSLPEFSISVIAALRRHADVAVGNILGSNIFNLLGILGISAVLQPLPINVRILQFDQWVMLVSALLLFIFLFTKRQLSRAEAILLLIGYGLYLSFSFTAFSG